MKFIDGNIYTITTINGKVYNRAKVIESDEHLISIKYTESNIMRFVILNVNEVTRLVSTLDNSKSYWYSSWSSNDHFFSPRLGISSVKLSEEEFKYNKEANKEVTFFESEKEAKEWLFERFKKNPKESEYFTFEDDACALYMSTSGEIRGKLAAEAKAYLEK